MCTKVLIRRTDSEAEAGVKPITGVRVFAYVSQHTSDDGMCSVLSHPLATWPRATMTFREIA